MATFVSIPTLTRAYPRVSARVISLGGQTITFQRADGTIGTATTLANVPTGAEVVRTVTA